MNEFTATFPSINSRVKTTATTIPEGRLLIDEADEIIYANTQARHFLGFLTEEVLPRGQKFLPLARTAYQCFPSVAWRDWPIFSHDTKPRFLIYTPPNGQGHMLLKVEVTEHIRLDGRDIWVITLKPVESKLTTAVTHLAI